jgi:hypothetical protein
MRGSIPLEELEERESDEMGMSILKFREHALEVFQKSYLVLHKLLRIQGE